jgi:hypothetical protein
MGSDRVEARKGLRARNSGLRTRGVTIEVRAAEMNPIDDAQRGRLVQADCEGLLEVAVGLSPPFEERPNTVAVVMGHPLDARLDLVV